eukprot:SAG22_NODE_934_length_6428_cov_3.928267_8_plen_250_part_00
MGQTASTPLEAALRDIESAGSGSGVARGGHGSELDRTISFKSDLESGLGVKQALRAQALRQKLRDADADITELRAALRRWDVLAGPSKTLKVCDVDCIVGGCGESVPADRGVLCAGCGLFLCHKCFGTTVVRAEVAVGGRYDRTIAAAAAPEAEAGAGGASGVGGTDSAAGSLPCPMFPQACGECGGGAAPPWPVSLPPSIAVLLPSVVVGLLASTLGLPQGSGTSRCRRSSRRCSTRPTAARTARPRT